MDVSFCLNLNYQKILFFSIFALFSAFKQTKLTYTDLIFNLIFISMYCDDAGFGCFLFNIIIHKTRCNNNLYDKQE